MKKISKDLIPTTQKDRKTGSFGYFNIWIGLAIIIASFSVGGEAVYEVNLQQTIIASFLGCMLLGIVITLVGDVGMEHGIAFPTYCRAVLGDKGLWILNVIRIIFGIIWFGIQTYYGALAINVIVAEFVGFDNWMIWFIVFAAVQVINTAMGFKSMERFANFAAPAIILIGIFMAYRLFGVSSSEGIQVWSRVLESDASQGLPQGFLVVMILNMCFWADATAESETWTRYIHVVPGEKRFIVRNKAALAGHMLALPFAETFMVFIGALSTIVVGDYNPINAIHSITSNSVVLSLLLLMVILAQWSTNNTANLMPAAISIVSLTKSRIKYPIGVVIVGVLGWLMRPWVVMDNINIFLSVLGSIWASVIGLTLADYFVIRKRRLNIPDLFDEEEGQFKFHGWNWAGVIALVISLTTCYFLADYTVFVGAVVTFVIYVILAKFWFFKKYPQAEMTAKGDDFLGISADREWLYDEENNKVYSFRRNKENVVDSTETK